MKIYLLRHGVTVAREGGYRQAPDTHLSSVGKKQATLVAKRLVNEGIDVILASPWTRAKETADIVAKKLGKPVELFVDIHEQERIAELHGAHGESEIALAFQRELAMSEADLDWKFQGAGESLREVAKRATRVKNHLLNQHLGQNVLVVSHAKFLKCFLIVCLMGDDYQDEAFVRLFMGMRFDNTGISLLEFQEEERRWILHYLNEYHHLRKIVSSPR